MANTTSVAFWKPPFIALLGLLLMGLPAAAQPGGAPNEFTGPLKFTMRGPKIADVGAPLTFEALIENVGERDSVEQTLVVATSTIKDPSITELGETKLEVPKLRPGQSKSYSFKLTAPRTGPFKVELTRGAIGLSETTVQVGCPLTFKLRGPDKAVIGQDMAFEVRVENATGRISGRQTLVVASSTIRDSVPRPGNLEFELEPVAPGQSRSFSFKLPAKRTGDFLVKLTRCGDGVADVSVPVRFDPAMKLADFLAPAPPAVPARPRLPADLSGVPEVAFAEPFAPTVPAGEVFEQLFGTIDKINHLNANKTDGYLAALIEHRADLAGLKFVLGDAARVKGSARTDLGQAARELRGLRIAFSCGVFAPEHLGAGFNLGRSPDGKKKLAKETASTRIRTLMHVFPMEAWEIKLFHIKQLAAVDHADATRALARLALFGQEERVRQEALKALDARPAADYVDELSAALAYPWPQIARNAVEAIEHLQCRQALPRLVEALERPDPRLPRSVKGKGTEVSVIAELVRVNNHRNCLLCHAPYDRDANALTARVPVPNQPFAAEYDDAPSPQGLLVRFDVTYLRPDFSWILPVENAAPWPRLQRFDFLVRQRQLTAEQANDYARLVRLTYVDGLSPYQTAALAGLRALTGQDVGVAAEAWRKLLAAEK